MQSVSDTTSSGATQPPPAPAKKNDSAATAASDFQNFLSLLTAQLRNQDPLSPLDSTQFVEQLASFSAVEQQINTNSKLDQLVEKLSASPIEEASQWIGKDVETVSGAARFEGEPVSYLIEKSAVGTTTEIIVSDLAGNEVYKDTGGSDRREFVWNGEDGNGGVVPNGDYVVKVNRYKDGELVDSSAPVAYTRVVQARFEENGGMQLVLENGALVAPSAISALRSPSAAAADES